MAYSLTVEDGLRGVPNDTAPNDPARRRCEAEWKRSLKAPIRFFMASSTGTASGAASHKGEQGCTGCTAFAGSVSLLFSLWREKWRE